MLSELSYYELSDLESDQSDIEFVTARPGATPRSKRANSRAKRATDSTVRKPKPKPKRLASATTVKDEETASISAGPTTKRKRPAPSGPRAKKVRCEVATVARGMDIAVSDTLRVLLVCVLQAPAKKKSVKTDE